MTNEENVSLMIGAWKLMTGRMPDHQIIHEDGVATMFGQVPCAFFNMSVVDSPLADLNAVRRKMNLLRERAVNCRFHWMAAVCENWMPDGWEGILPELGLGVAMRLTGMATEQMLPCRRAPANLDFRRVSAAQVAREVAAINADAYEMPIESMDCIAQMHLWQPDSLGIVGYLDGRAVSCAAAFPVDGTVYAAMVATLPEAHGRGYAETVMRHVLEQGAGTMGVRRLTLHATEAGRPLYAAMGFETGGQMAIIAPAEEGH